MNAAVSRNRPRERGFAFLLAALTLALMALALVATLRAQDASRGALFKARAELAQTIAARSLAARLSFVALTEPAGLDAILVGGPRESGDNALDIADGARTASGARVRKLRLDGTLYADPAGWGGPGVRGGQVLVSLQDDAGLLNVNAGDDRAVAALLSLLGVPRARASRLAGALGDFVDPDDLVRPGGGEREDYLRAGLAPPPDAPMRRPWAALGALGWADGLDARQRRDAFDLLAAAPPGQAVNVNTAPPRVLEAVLGDARQAREVLARRAVGPLATADDIAALAGPRTRADGVVLAARPGDAVRVRIGFYGPNGAGRRWVEGWLRRAGPGAGRPIVWQEEQRALRLGEALKSLERVHDHDLLPESPALPPARERRS